MKLKASEISPWKVPTEGLLTIDKEHNLTES